MFKVLFAAHMREQTKILVSLRTLKQEIHKKYVVKKFQKLCANLSILGIKMKGKYVFFKKSISTLKGISSMV
jgi:hypothetical protein